MLALGPSAPVKAPLLLSLLVHLMDGEMGLHSELTSGPASFLQLLLFWDPKPPMSDLC